MVYIHGKSELVVTLCNINLINAFVRLTGVLDSHTGVQEKLGVMNKGTVYALWDYKAQNPDELTFSEGDTITILQRQDDSETEWWWARLEDSEGYVPRNLLGVRKKLHFLRDYFTYFCPAPIFFSIIFANYCRNEVFKLLNA